MAGQLRSSVGFLGGGGVTPSPTPTPKARLARFILVPYGAEGEVQVLTDTYGRILTQYTEDGDYRTACVYVPGDSRIDWDTLSDQELVTLLGKYGYNDALTIENNDVTITANGETETLIWDSTAMDFTVDVDMFVNGSQNMYYRTVNDGSRDVTVLVDAEGKAIMVTAIGEYPGGLFSVANNGTEIDTITEGSLISQEGVINACGGSVNVTALDAGSSVYLLVMGTHVQYCNADNLTTTPSVAGWPIVEIWADELCTVRPTGSTDHVFAQVKETFGVNDGRQWGNTGDLLIISTPSTEYPQDGYAISWYIDFANGEFTGPITPGVYRLENVLGSVDVTGYVTKFA